jgi:glycosyltransferase involved in cell wall biosynthesis
MRLLNQNEQLIAVSQATRAFHVKRGLDPERTCVLYNGIDCERFRPRPRTDSLRHEPGFPKDAFVIATIGQISERKGQDVLAEAAGQVRTRLPKAHYLIVGERQSAKQETAECEARVKHLFELADLADRVRFTGRREDIPALLNDVDLLAHPARQEPFGRVLLEAAAAGTPILATTVGGTTEMLVDGETARLVPPDDPHALAEAMIELHDDPARRARHAGAARQHIMKHFSIERAAGQVAALWDAVAGGCPPAGH